MPTPELAFLQEVKERVQLMRKHFSETDQVRMALASLYFELDRRIADMPTTEELHELAVRALNDFYRDRSVTFTEKYTGLQGLRAELDALLVECEREAGAEHEQEEHDDAADNGTD